MLKSKVKKSKSKVIILLNNPVVCDCSEGFYGAFYPTLKNKNSKTFKCDYCGKTYYTASLNLK